MNDKQECNILVCGSQRFTERSFVFKVLTTFYQRIPIDNIVVSTTSGACEFAKDWVNFMNDMLAEAKMPLIGIKTFDYDKELEENSSSIYESNIPDFVLQNDKFFQKGVEEILKHSIKAVLAIPNPEGVLGVSTNNIKRFCELSGNKDIFFDCSELHTLLDKYHHDMGTPKEDLENINLEPKEEASKPTEPVFGSLKRISPR